MLTLVGYVRADKYTVYRFALITGSRFIFSFNNITFMLWLLTYDWTIVVWGRGLGKWSILDVDNMTGNVLRGIYKKRRHLPFRRSIIFLLSKPWSWWKLSCSLPVVILVLLYSKKKKHPKMSFNQDKITSLMPAVFFQIVYTRHKGAGYQAQTGSIKKTTVYHLFIHQKTIGRYDCNLLD